MRRHWEFRCSGAQVEVEVEAGSILPVICCWQQQQQQRAQQQYNNVDVVAIEFLHVAHEVVCLPGIAWLLKNTVPPSFSWPLALEKIQKNSSIIKNKSSN